MQETKGKKATLIRFDTKESRYLINSSLIISKSLISYNCEADCLGKNNWQFYDKEKDWIQLLLPIIKDTINAKFDFVVLDGDSTEISIFYDDNTSEIIELDMPIKEYKDLYKTIKKIERRMKYCIGGMI